MYVSALTNATGAQGAASPQTVDYQSFLKLLVAQMKNQDPTSPMESTDYVAQLATFSQVEQSIQMNTKLQSMLQTSAMAQATGLIGREVEAMDGSVTGIVTQVEIYSDGVALLLDNGKKVEMGPGVIIREAGSAPVTPEEPPEGDSTESGQEA